MSNTDDRAEFEAWWRAEMNVEVMDLARTAYPMTPPEKQMYKCHETERAWLTWQAARRAQVVQQVQCVICGSDEPYVGTCGSNDPRALCKKPAPQPPEAVCNPSMQPELATKAAPVQMPEAVVFAHVPAKVWIVRCD